MTINFAMDAKSLDGSDMIESGEVINMGKTLANWLANSSKGADAIKFYDWALKLYKTGTLDLDNSDWDKLKKFITEVEGMSNSFRAQLLQRFILTPE